MDPEEEAKAEGETTDEVPEVMAEAGVDEDMFEQEQEGGGDVEDEMYDFQMVHVRHNTRARTQDTNGKDEHEDEGEGNNQPQPENPTWFFKIQPLIEHTRTISLWFIVVLGMVLLIDEMMIRFGGRSSQMHCMKNKPISEGYNFLWWLA